MMFYDEVIIGFVLKFVVKGIFVVYRVRIIVIKIVSIKIVMINI